MKRLVCFGHNLLAAMDTSSVSRAACPAAVAVASAATVGKSATLHAHVLSAAMDVDRAVAGKAADFCCGLVWSANTC